MLCKNCGTELNPDAAFCKNCGVDVKGEENVQEIIDGNSLFEENNSQMNANPADNNFEDVNTNNAQGGFAYQQPANLDVNFAGENQTTEDGGLTPAEVKKPGTELKNLFKRKKNKAQAPPSEAPPSADNNFNDPNINNPPVDAMEGEAAGSKNNTIPAIIIIVACAVLVLCLITFGLLSFNTAKDDEYENILIAATEDDFYLVDAANAIELGEIEEDATFYERVAVTSNDSAYIIEDVEYDDDAMKVIGTLVYVKGEKRTEIDENVVVGKLEVVEQTLWYLKADSDEFIVCSAIKTKTREVSETFDISDIYYLGNKDGRSAYVLAYEDDDELFYKIANGENEEISDDLSPVGISADYKYILFTSIEDPNELYIYNGKEMVEIYDDFGDSYAEFVEGTGDVVLINENDELIYLAYNKDEYEIDDNIYHFYMLDSKEYGSFALYEKDDGDVYLVDVSKKNAEGEKIIKGRDNVGYEFIEGLLYIPDDDEVRILNVRNMKETVIELEDADDVQYYDLGISKKHIIYYTEDYELAVTDGKDAAILEKDINYITRFGFGKDKKSVYYLDEDEFYLTSLDGQDGEKILKDIYELLVLNDAEQLYAIVDYEDDDGGDLVYFTENGKVYDVLDKVMDYYTLSYIK